MRWGSEFYAKLRKLRESYGDKEYSIDDLRGPTVDLIRDHLNSIGSPDALLLDVAKKVLDEADKSDDRAGQGLFPFETHVALGDKQRIQRGAMGIDHLRRRKRVIDHNKISQDRAWAAETSSTDIAIELLSRMPSSYVYRDVMEEDGTPKKDQAAD